MKKLFAILLSGIMLLSLVACGGTPSDKKIKAALDDGTITIEDAKEKGWIDEAWIEDNFKPIDAKSKIHLFEEFQTTYLDGSPTSSDIISGKMCLVFFDTTQPQAMEKLKVFEEINEQLKEIGVPVLGIITDKDVEAAKEKLSTVLFPVIVCNDEMQKSLVEYNQLLDSEFASIFTKEGGFYTAWNSDAKADELLKLAQGLANEE